MKSLFFFLFIFLSFTLVGAAVDIGEENTLARGVNILPPPFAGSIFLNNTGSVNSTQFWDTNIGSLGDVNTTQFSNNGGFLNIIQSWIESLAVNPFDQVLNTTSNVNFGNLTVLSNLTVGDDGILSSGNVKIQNTISPTLIIDDPDGKAFMFQAATNSVLNFDTTGTFTVRHTSASDIRAGSNSGTTVMVIEPTGQIRMEGTFPNLALNNGVIGGNVLSILAGEDDHFSAIVDAFAGFYYFEAAAEGEVQEFRVYGRGTGGTRKYVSLSISNDTNSNILIDHSGTVAMEISGANVEVKGTLGIGTGTPPQTLNVIGDGNITADLFVQDDLFVFDQVGIGTTSPTTTLHLVDTSPIIRLETDTSALDNAIQFVNSTGLVEFSIVHDTSAGRFKFFGPNSRNMLELKTNTTVTINQDGRPDIDFRVESDFDNGAIIVDAGTGDVTIGNLNDSFFFEYGENRIGIRTKAPTAILHVQDDSAVDAVGRFESTDDRAYIQIDDDADTARIGVQGDNLFFGSAASNSANNLIWDITQQLLGIGTTTPTYKLDVRGNVSLNETLFVNTNGLVGIGTSFPVAPLHVNVSSGNVVGRFENTGTGHSNVDIISVDGDSGDPRLRFHSGFSTNVFTIGIDDNDGNKFKISNATSLGTNDWLTILSTGLIGIGTTTPTHLLNVDGDVNITEGNTLLNGRNVLHVFSTIPSSTFTTTPINITWAGETVDGSFYSHTQGFFSTNVTVLRSGLYKITADASTDVDTGSTRSVSRAYIVDDNVEITGTSCFMYNRIAGNGDQSCSITTIRALSADSEIQLRIERHTGSDTLIATANSNRITFEYLGETG